VTKPLGRDAGCIMGGESSSEGKNNMRRNFYMVSMVLERENEDIETWTGFGGTYIRNKALATAREV
jgi:hypothetical protein